jgi:hypothetical protein
MDFIVGLPVTAHKFDSIWVIVGRLSKSAHFIPVNTRYRVEKYAEIYIACVLCLHRVRKTIISELRFELCRSLLGEIACVPRDSLDP